MYGALRRRKWVGGAGCAVLLGSKVPTRRFTAFGGKGSPAAEATSPRSATMGAAVRIIVEVAPGAVLVKCACAGIDGETGKMLSQRGRTAFGQCWERREGGGGYPQLPGAPYHKVRDHSAGSIMR